MKRWNHKKGKRKKKKFDVIINGMQTNHLPLDIPTAIDFYH